MDYVPPTREQELKWFGAEEPVKKFDGWAIIVEVYGGVAEITQSPKRCEEIVVDYDNFPDAKIDWDKRTITWGEPA